MVSNEKVKYLIDEVTTVFDESIEDEKCKLCDCYPINCDSDCKKNITKYLFELIGDTEINLDWGNQRE